MAVDEYIIPVDCASTALIQGEISASSLADYAKKLGAEPDYAYSTSSEDGFNSSLGQFKKNIMLLISKTWVKTEDEILKERLNAKVGFFIKKINAGFYEEAAGCFSEILEELAFLFFGAQSTKEDFIEYAFRIDDHFGYFYCYAKRLPRLCEKSESKLVKHLLLLGISYLKTL